MRSTNADLFRCFVLKDGYDSDFDSIFGWNLEFRRNLNDWVLEAFYQLTPTQQLDPISIDQNNEDGLIWVNSKDKMFSDSNCYKLLLNQNGQGTSN